jgi:predicted lipoprotein with Yx(FWY)xxD motif
VSGQLAPRRCGDDATSRRRSEHEYPQIDHIHQWRRSGAAHRAGGRGLWRQRRGPSTGGGTSSTVGVGSSNTLGSILVDSQGRTLYLFAQDTGSTSTCSGACAAAWPPLTTSGTPTVGGGANASLVGTTTRSDNSQQVTYNGHPLYLFNRDTNPGDTNGQGVIAFGASWFAVSPSGNQVNGQPSGSGGGTNSGGGGLGY